MLPSPSQRSSHDLRARVLHKRFVSQTGQRVATIAVISVIVLVSLTIVSYITLKSIRKRHSNPKYLPTQYLKTKWRRWNVPPSRTAKSSYSNRLQESSSVPTLYLRRHERDSAHVADIERGLAQDEDRGVDRHQSVRSVMTLPSYSKAARDNEEILGREGERGGIDVVVEAPETIDEEEARREEEMESLYQIRLQRRRENEERADRRQRRREARDRNDVVTLRELRHESLLRAGERDSAGGATAMIAEHQSRSRDRRVSSVSYADLGVARHDGTRLRANSSESDRQPLMDSAAGMGSSIRPWLASEVLGPHHHRNRSASSLRSVSDLSDSDVDSIVPPFGRSGSDFDVVTLNNGQHSRNPSQTNLRSSTRSRASSNLANPPLDTGDLGSAGFSSREPPSYEHDDAFEEAPPYTSPVETRAPAFSDSEQAQPNTADPQQGRSWIDPGMGSASIGILQLPEIRRLPSIRIADATPVETNSPHDIR